MAEILADTTGSRSKVRNITTINQQGVCFETTTSGDATNFPIAGDTVKVHYVGRLQDNSVFDSSRARNKPFSFRVGTGQVIRAWDLAIPMLSRGQIVTLTCPPDFAYGSRGYPPIIPPNSTLIFEVELISMSST